MKKDKLIDKIFGVALVFVMVGAMLGGLSGDVTHAADLDLSFSSAPTLAASENEGDSPAQSALGTIYFTIYDPGGGDQPSMTYTHTETYTTTDSCKLQVCLQDVGVNPGPEPPSWADDIANVYVDGVLIETYDSLHNRLPYPGPGPVQCFTSGVLEAGTHTITVEMVYSWVAGSMFAKDITAIPADTTPPAAVTDLHAIAIDLTSTGFVYPTGMAPTLGNGQGVSYNYIDAPDARKYYNYPGWLANGDRGHYQVNKYHIGQDIPADVWDPVYAITEGEIVRVHKSDDSWGIGNYGVFIRHRLSTGEEFLALYGHIKPLENDTFYEGQNVTAGEVFAQIGPFSDTHLHFGICDRDDVPNTHEDAQNPRNNVGWGRMGLNNWGKNWPDETNCFVDPIKWIITKTPEPPMKPTSVVLSWTAPADDGNDVGSGPASQYDIRYSTRPIETNEEWESATQCMGEPQPGDAGSMDSFVVTDLFPATAYHFALKAYDEAGNPSGLSNVPWEITPGIMWYLCSPVDMIVTDPDGLTISRELNEIPGATCLEIDLNGDGDPDDVVAIPNRKIGDYLITVVPELGASPADTYTLGVTAGGVTIVLAENVRVADIPVEGYIVRSTETEIMQIVPATIDFDPDTLNLKVRDKWVAVYIELPTGHGYDVSQIDLGSIRLNGIVPALAKPTKIGDHDRDGIPDLMVKFDAAAVKKLLTPGCQVEITIAGKVAGIAFEGSDTIRVISGSRFWPWLCWPLPWLTCK